MTYRPAGGAVVRITRRLRLPQRCCYICGRQSAWRDLPRQPWLQCADQSLATIRIRKERGQPDATLAFLVQSLQAIDGANAHPMVVWKAEHRKTLRQIYLRPTGQLRVTHPAILERHVEQALGLIGIAGTEHTSYLFCHWRALIEL